MSRAKQEVVKGGLGTHVELPHLVLDVAGGEVLHVGQLEVHLREPHQDPLAGPLEVLPLGGEVLQDQAEPRRCDDVTRPAEASTRRSYPEAPDDGGDPPLEVVPPPVPLFHHLLQPAGCVRPVLPGQPAVLFVHQLQLSQALVDLPLERLPEPQGLACRALVQRV